MLLHNIFTVNKPPLLLLLLLLLVVVVVVVVINNIIILWANRITVIPSSRVTYYRTYGLKISASSKITNQILLALQHRKNQSHPKLQGRHRNKLKGTT